MIKFITRKNISTLIFSLLFFVNIVSAREISLSIDNVKTMSFSRNMGTVVVGNPSIANAQIADERLLIVFPMGLGETNIVVLDENNNKIDEFNITVYSSVPGRITYYAGDKKRTYRCLPKCEAVAVIGDDADHFKSVNSQISDRYSLSSGIAGNNDGHKYSVSYKVKNDTSKKDK